METIFNQVKLTFNHLLSSPKSISEKLNKAKLTLKFIYFRLIFRPKVSLKIDLIFLENNLHVESKIVREIFQRKDFLQFKNRPILYYFDSVVLHENHEQLNVTHRPVWSPILFDQFYYLGEFLVLLNNDTIISSYLDIREFILKNNPVVIKIKDLPYFKIEHHAIQNNDEISMFRETEMPALPKKALLGGISVIIPTTFVNHNLMKGHSLSKLVSDIHLILKNNNCGEDYQIFLIYGSEFNPADKLIFEDDDLLNGIKIELLFDRRDFNFSERVNIGMSHAKFETVLIINDDVVIDKPINLVNVLGLLSMDNVATVSYCLKDSLGNLSHCGIAITEGHANEYLKGTSVYEFRPEFEFAREVDGNSFAFVFVNRQRFNSIGPLDVMFPLDFNDVEWCIRASELGYSHILLPDVIATHNISSTRLNNSSGASFYNALVSCYEISNSISEHEWVIHACCHAEVSRKYNVTQHV
jgi:hypothetical protein